MLCFPEALKCVYQNALLQQQPFLLEAISQQQITKLFRHKQEKRAKIRNVLRQEQAKNISEQVARYNCNTVIGNTSSSQQMLMLALHGQWSLT